MPDKAPVMDLESEEGFYVTHPLQVFRGFKEKITPHKKERNKLIKRVAHAVLDPSFLAYCDSYAENVARFLEQLEEKEIQKFYKTLDKAKGEAVGAYQNLIAGIERHAQDWKIALAKDKASGKKLLESIFKKKKKVKDIIEFTDETHEELALENKILIVFCSKDSMSETDSLYQQMHRLHSNIKTKSIQFAYATMSKSPKFFQKYGITTTGVVIEKALKDEYVFKGQILDKDVNDALFEVLS